MVISRHKRGIILILLVFLGIWGVKVWMDSRALIPHVGEAIDVQVVATPTSTAANEESVILDGPLGQLLLEIDHFPPGWHIWPPCADPNFTTENLTETSRTVLSPNEFSGKTIQDLYWFKTPHDASAYWARLKDVYNLQRIGVTLYESRYAIDEGMWCGMKRIPMCQVVTRYRNIVNVWFIHIDYGDHPVPAGMKMEDAEAVFRAADTHIGETLGLPIRKP